MKNKGQFAKGHIGYWKNKHLSANHKKALGESLEREKSCFWKGGRTVIKAGYVKVKNRKHPFCNKDGYVYEHRLVIERYIGRYLKPSEHCHHINKIKDDNIPQNLMAFTTNSTHIKFEFSKRVKPEEIIFDGRKLSKPKERIVCHGKI